MGKPVGIFPTPYGVTVPVFENPNDPEGCLFDLDGAAICACIYDPSQRLRFAEAVKRGGDIELSDFGGMKLPKVPLPRPAKAAYPTIPQEIVGAQVEAWTDLILETPRWCDRAAAILDIIDANLKQVAKPDPLVPAELFAGGLSITLAAALEHLGETEVDCIEAAAIYGVSAHEEWNTAGLAWLTPFRTTWALDWIAARSVYQRFAKLCGEVGIIEAPGWLIGESANG